MYYKNQIYLIFIICFLSPLYSFGQLTKEEKKALKKELKEYKKWKPIEIKVLKEDFDEHRVNMKNMEREISQQSRATDSLRQEYSTINNRLNECKTELEKSQSIVQQPSNNQGKKEEPSLASASEVKTPKGTVTPSQDMAFKSSQADKGVVFKIQLGAYKNYDLIKKLSNEEGIIQEIDNGLFKYTLGTYRTVAEAKELQNEIRKMGIADAWVVSYIDGKRVHIKDALNATKTQANAGNYKNEIFATTD